MILNNVLNGKSQCNVKSSSDRSVLQCDMLYVSYTPLSYELLLMIQFEVIQMSNDK